MTTPTKMMTTETMKTLKNDSTNQDERIDLTVPHRKQQNKEDVGAT